MREEAKHVTHMRETTDQQPKKRNGERLNAPDDDAWREWNIGLVRPPFTGREDEQEEEEEDNAGRSCPNPLLIALLALGNLDNHYFYWSLLRLSQRSF